MKTQAFSCRVASIAIVAMFAGVLLPQSPDTPIDRHLIVGTKQSPPFAFRNPDGEWTGISIELWEQLANELDLDFELRELTLDEMFTSLEAGEIDAAVAAISVTAERHQRVEFCHPHFTTGLGIAVSATRGTGIWSLVRRIVSSRLLMIVAGVVASVIVCGTLFWAFERRGNAAVFGGDRRRGIGMGLWWSMTLLLGHKGVVPVSVLGRIVAACSMVASILLLSLLTGVIASVLTVQQLETGIAHPTDLRYVRTMTIASSTSAEYLARRQISFQTRATADAALQAIIDGQADAVVYDEALLRYLSRTKFPEGIQVLPVQFNTQEYAIALRPNSELRKPLNEAMLRFRAGDSWDELIYRYLGD